MRKQISVTSPLQPMLQSSMIQKQSGTRQDSDKNLFEKIEKERKNQNRYFSRTLAWEKNINQLEFE